MNAPVDHTQLAQFNDSFVNWLAGLGVPGRDKGASQQFTFNPLSRMELEFAYRGDWIARKVIDIPADDATREWRSWQTSNKNIERIEEVENQLFVQRKVKKAMQLARLYGGAALVLGVGTDDTAEELVPDAVNKDDLKFIHAIPAHCITSGALITDLTSEYYGEPEYYTTLGSMTGTAITPGKTIHPSRVIRFLGNELPDPNMMMGVSAQGWGDSVLQPIAEAIKAVGLVSGAGATLASEAKIDVIKMPGLSERIATQEYKDMLTARFSYSNVAKSLINTLVLDGEEEWQRINAEFRDIPELIKVYLLMVSGACDIPATRMLGQSPQGLNATGESDLQNYYDNVGAEQKNTIQPTLARFDEVLIRSALGSRDASIYYDWRPLWQMSEDAASKVYLAKAQIFKIDADEGLIDSEALRVGRQNQLIEDGVYPGLEEALEAQEALGEASMLSPEEQAAEAEAEQAQQLQHQVKLAQATGKPKPITKDATPRTLYVYRPVLNWRDIARWAKSQGFATTLGSDMHVTVIYSKAQVDWMKVNDDSWSNSDDGTMHVAPGGPRMLEKFGDATVLVFANSRLAWRHGDIRRTTGASFDFDEYQPHITITYKVPTDLDVAKIAAYNGEIELGPECFEEINDNYESEVVEDGVIPFDGFDPDEPRDYHGRWSGSGGGTAPYVGGQIGYQPSKEDQVGIKALERDGRNVAKRLGYDPDKVHVSLDEHPFTLNGQSYKAAGTANLNNGEIRLYYNQMKNLSPFDTLGVIAHEVQHEKFEFVKKEYERERDVVMALPRESGPKGDIMKPDGSLREPYDKQYPIYSGWVEHMDKNWDTLREQDGVSDYSRSWWEAVNKGTGVIVLQAVHETLAEIASFDEQGIKDRLTAIKDRPKWVRLYNWVNKTFAKTYKVPS